MELRPRYELGPEGSIVGVLPFSPPSRPSQDLARGWWDRLRLKFEYARLNHLYRKAKVGMQLWEGFATFPTDAYIFEEPWRPEYLRAWSDAKWGLALLIEEVRKDAARPIIVLIPSKWTVSDWHWSRLEAAYPGSGRLVRTKARYLLREFCRKSGVEYLDLMDPFWKAMAEGRSLYWVKDSHLTAAGHRVVAEELCRIITPDPHRCPS
ncbi:MAG: hypothetical protein HYY13_04865 [Nitrospirae bacterium]|nr:hypothetical protein [Nitrospirota bacterium]